MSARHADRVVQAGGLQELVDDLAERLQRSVALDDPAIRLIVASRHFGDEDAVRVQSILGRGVDAAIRNRVLSLGIDAFEGPGRLEPLTDFGAKARVCVPVRCAGMLLGYLWLIDDDHLTDEDIADAASVAEAAGLILYRRDLVLQRRQARHGALLRDLLSADQAARTGAEQEAYKEAIVAPASSVSIVVVRSPRREDTGEAAEASALTQVARHILSAYPEGSLICLPRPQDLVVLIVSRAGADAKQVPTVARRLVGETADLVGRRAVAGIGMPQPRLNSAYHSYRQAVVGARAGEFLPGLGDVVSWESLGVYALLAKLEPQDLSLAAYPVSLARLVNNRNGRKLVSTAETYLDLAGNVQRTAKALHIHRATLYQRLARIEEVSGLDLSAGGDRLTLHLAIKLARLTGAYQE